MKKIPIILFILFLGGCGSDNNELATHTGIVTDLIKEENGTRIHVEGVEGGEENTIAFFIPNESADEINLNDNVTVFYNENAGREESLPPNQDGFERIEFH